MNQLSVLLTAIIRFWVPTFGARRVPVMTRTMMIKRMMRARARM